MKKFFAFLYRLLIKPAVCLFLAKKKFSFSSFFLLSVLVFLISRLTEWKISFWLAMVVIFIFGWILAVVIGLIFPERKKAERLEDLYSDPELFGEGGEPSYDNMMAFNEENKLVHL